MPDLFDKAVSAAIRRVSDRMGQSVDNALINALLSLRQAAEPLVFENYVAGYEADQVNFYLSIDSGTSSFYSQLHSTLALASALVAVRADPPLADVNGLAALEKRLADDPAHPLAGALRSRRREIDLLRWLSRVRHKSVQHRVESESLRASVMLDVDGVVIIRTLATPEPGQVRKARSLLTGFNRKYGNQLDTTGTHEPIARLDVASHFLFEWGEFGDYYSARRVVEESRLFHLTITPPLIRNADAALAALIEAAPVDPDAPFADGPQSAE